MYNENYFLVSKYLQLFIIYLLLEYLANELSIKADVSLYLSGTSF